MAMGFGVAVPKPTKRKTLKGRKTRAEKKVKDAVRLLCTERDSICRFGEWEDNPEDWHSDELTDNDEGCDGPPQWSHLPAKRRSKTRGMLPEERHDTAHTLILCRRHHDQLDGRARPRLLITAMTPSGADGPLRFESKS